MPGCGSVEQKKVHLPDRMYIATDTNAVCDVMLPIVCRSFVLRPNKLSTGKITVLDILSPIIFSCKLYDARVIIFPLDFVRSPSMCLNAGLFFEKMPFFAAQGRRIRSKATHATSSSALSDRRCRTFERPYRFSDARVGVCRPRPSHRRTVPRHRKAVRVLPVT